MEQLTPVNLINCISLASHIVQRMTEKEMREELALIFAAHFRNDPAEFHKREAEWPQWRPT